MAGKLAEVWFVLFDSAVRLGGHSENDVSNLGSPYSMDIHILGCIGGPEQSEILRLIRYLLAESPRLGPKIKKPWAPSTPTN